MKWIMLGLDWFMKAVKLVWRFLRVPVSMPIVGIVLVCAVISIPIWFVMACVACADAEDLCRDFKNWYIEPVIDYWHWCLRSFSSKYFS